MNMRKVTPVRWLLGSAAFLTWLRLVVGCNTVSSGECWPNTSGGVGGGGPFPIGAGVGATTGDYFSLAPPKAPLADDGDYNPCIAPDTPCNQKCAAAWETGSIGCAKIEDGAQRKACEENVYAAYKSCRQVCAQGDDCLEHCKELCLKLWEKCQDDCPPKDGNCRSECTNALGRCNRDCDKKCG